MPTGPEGPRRAAAGEGSLGAAAEPWSAAAAQRAWAALSRVRLGYFAVDHRSGTVSAANDAFAQMFGYDSAAEVVGVSVIDHYQDPKERAEAAARIYGHPDLRRQGFIRFAAKRVDRRSGKNVDVLMSLVPTWDADGAVVDVDGFCERVGDRDASERAFAESEARFRILFETAAIGQALLSPEGALGRVNDSLAQLLGLSREAAVKTDLLALLDPEDRGAAREMLDATLAQGSCAARSGAEWRFRHASGATVWGQVHGSWLVTDGKAHSLALFVSDVSARRRLEEVVLRMEKLKAIGTLAGGIAHDFNNVLAAILGNLSLAHAELEPESEVAGLLRQAELAAQRAGDLTQQLITFASGGSPVKVPLSLERLARETAECCLKRYGVRVQYDIAADLAPVLADPGQMTQVLLNLLVNAAEAGPRDRAVTVRMRNCPSPVAASPPGPAPAMVRVDVEDRGSGMSAEELGHIFDAYASTKRRGSGLGLATVLSIVTRHDGHIEAQSSPGVGTTMSFWLHATDQRPAAAADQPSGLGAHHVGPLRVLVMDDDAIVRTMIAAILTRLGASVRATCDGAEAVAAHREGLDLGQPYDLAILDLSVCGGMGGREALQRIRAAEPGLRAVVCSGYSADPVLADPRGHGFDGVLPKPFSLAQLAQVVRTVVDRPPQPQVVRGA